MAETLNNVPCIKSTSTNGFVIPDDYHILCSWFPLLRHARQVAQSNGMSVITIRVIVDDLGNPLEPWPTPEAVRLLPRKSGKDTISDLLHKLMDAA